MKQDALRAKPAEKSHRLPALGDRLPWTFALAIIAVAAGIWPHLVNGFPLVYSDSNAYISFPESGRAPFPPAYAIAIWLFRPLGSLAVVTVVQAICMAYVLVVAFWTFARVSLQTALLLTIALISLSQLPWLTSWLTPDWLGGCGIIATLSYLVRRRDRHSRPLLAIIGFSVMASTANLLVLAPILPILVIGLAVTAPESAVLGKAIRLGFVLSLCTGLTIAYNSAINQKPAMAIGSSARLFSKLVDKGLAAPYLAARCREGQAAACQMNLEISRFRYREEFLWGPGGRVLDALAARDHAWTDPSGRYQALDNAIILQSPIAAAQAGADDAWQLARMHTLSRETKELVPHEIDGDPVKSVMARFYPGSMPSYEHARQQQNRLLAVFPARFYEIGTILSYVGCVVALAIGWKTGNRRLIGLSAATIAILLWSICVHGGLSLPVARYSVKNSWLALFVTITTAASLVQARFSDAGRRQSGGGLSGATWTMARKLAATDAAFPALS